MAFGHLRQTHITEKVRLLTLTHGEVEELQERREEDEHLHPSQDLAKADSGTCSQHGGIFFNFLN